MLLEQLLDSNPNLINAAVELHQSGVIPANCWLYDLDAVAANAQVQAAEARRLGLTTFLMTKQIARNPMVTTVALRNGLDKTVAVDMACAHILNRYGIPIGHIGHLNQIPKHQVAQALSVRPDFVTVYSVEAARRISAAAREQGVMQSLLVRPYAGDDVFFPGQEGGFREAETVDAVREIATLPNVTVIGVTSFPCIAYSLDWDRKAPSLNPNMETIVRVARRIEEELGLEMRVINAPGNTSASSFQLLKDAGATHVEPGHGVCGTSLTQMMTGEEPEIPAYVYVTEISHIYEGRGYGFGGGLWSLMTGWFGDEWNHRALVGSTPESAKATILKYAHLDQNIDYHLPLEQGDRCQAGDTVVFPIYTQAQMTRSYTVAVSGISSGNPKVAGLFDHAGTMLDETFAPVPLGQALATLEDSMTVALADR